MSVESLGRISDDGIALLQQPRSEARLLGKRRLGRAPGLNLARLRSDLEAAVLRGHVDYAILALRSHSVAALGWFNGSH